MKRETLIWTIVFVLGAAGLLYNAVIRPGGMAKQYVKTELVNPDHPEAGTTATSATVKEFKANPQSAQFSFWRTLGVWFAAFLTLCIFSFQYRDNPFYKFAESVFIGVSAAAYMVAGFWEQIMPNLVGELAPWAVRSWALPGIELDPAQPWFTQVRWVRIIPLILGIMLLWRLAPRGQWIARWPLAIIIGTKAGIQLMVYIQSDLMGQVGQTIIPLVAVDASGAIDFWQSLRNAGIVLGVLACLFYFFFSVEHKGINGRMARTGIWVLMITFGASFALTVMGRIALLSDRLNFLVDDWLWLIDPGKNRAAAAIVGMLQSPLVG
jgi:hypothetical protein